MPARTPRAPPHVSLRRPGLPSRPAVAVSGLGGASSGPRLVDHQLVGPLFDLTSERPRPSTMERTLYGEEEEQEDPFAPPALPETTIGKQFDSGPICESGLHYK